MIGMAMYFAWHPKSAIFYILITLAILGAGVAIYFISQQSVVDAEEGFRLTRIRAWLDPYSYESDTSYQSLQALYAIGSGGLFGKGLGNSIQKLGSIPEAQNDMIFSIVCEELGLIGAFIILTLFLLLIWRFFVIATHARDLFGALIATGAMAHMMIQVILNIAVVTNTIPNTGITLPFVSYGGTALLISMAEIGVALGVSRKIKLDEPEIVEKESSMMLPTIGIVVITIVIAAVIVIIKNKKGQE